MLFDEANRAQRLMRQLAGSRVMAWLFARVLHRLDLLVLRRTAGRHSLTAALTGLPMVELTTTGAHSGKPRINLKAHPRCGVVVRGRRYDMEAHEAQGEERDRLWALDCSVYPARRLYAARAGGRRIPVMVLQPLRPEPRSG